MKISELKRGQKLRHIETGEICKVSKQWDGIRLIDPETKKAKYRIYDFLGEDEFGGWEKVA